MHVKICGILLSTKYCINISFSLLLLNCLYQLITLDLVFKDLVFNLSLICSGLSFWTSCLYRYIVEFL